jgi:hypothetical protein
VPVQQKEQNRVRHRMGLHPPGRQGKLSGA